MSRPMAPQQSPKLGQEDSASPPRIPSDEEDSTTSDSSSEQSLEQDDSENDQSQTNGEEVPFTRFSLSNEQMRATGRVSRTDGRLKVSLNERANRGHIADALGAGIRHHLDNPSRFAAEPDGKLGIDGKAVEEELGRARLKLRERPFAKLNIVVMVLGSRGDIQPFLKIGKILKEEHGHRVRIATHPAFEQFVEESGLEFFSVGGDPSELMAFMVKNPGLIPSLETIRKGEIGKRRASMAEMFEGFWKACISSTEENDFDTGTVKYKRPFVADAIIANPPTFAHVHCAERLGCPLHLIFTFPYTPTQNFPHPLANIKPGNVDWRYTNFMSYSLVEMMTWQGLGDLVNRFRVKTLGLDPVSTLWAPGQLFRLKVPYTYLWSPGLVPKPEDWGPEIDIAGFVFLDLASTYEPSEALQKFLEAGDPPVYIGFGSIVIDDPNQFTKLIFEAVRKAGVRAVVSKGWGGFGSDEDTPENIFMIDNVPHDWLFPQCRAVVHHGGAGTTAIGLKCAKPTMIVPFFGDQPFWGSMVAEAKAGAHECIPYKRLTADGMARGIKECLSEEAQENVQKISDSIANEGDGAVNAVASFHSSIPWYGTTSLRCSILDDHVAVWQLKNSHLRLSALAAELLVRLEKITYKQLELLRAYEWNDFQGPGGPITGVSSAILSNAAELSKGVSRGPYLMGKDIHTHTRYERKKRKKKKKERKKLQQAQGEAVDTSITNDTNGHGQNDHGELPESTQNASRIAPDAREQSEETYDPSDPTDLPSSSQKLRERTTTLSKYKPTATITSDLARDVTWTVGRTVKVMSKAPMEVLLGLGQGLHNAPRLYGDNTVRRPRRITDFRSGLRAGTSAFAHDMSDAITGFVRHPMEGKREGGRKGFAKGAAKGLGGLVLKSNAAIVEPVAFAMKGLEKEYARDPMTGVRAAREEQGRLEADALGEDPEAQEVARVEHGWEVMTELWQRGQTLKKGLMGRLFFRKEARMWEKYGALLSVEVSERALEARRNGVAFADFMEEFRKDVDTGSGLKPQNSGVASKD